MFYNQIALMSTPLQLTRHQQWLSMLDASVAFSSAYVTGSGFVDQQLVHADSIYCIHFQKMDRGKFVETFLLIMRTASHTKQRTTDFVCVIYSMRPSSQGTVPAGSGNSLG